jgi:hypothetical protein
VEVGVDIQQGLVKEKKFSPGSKIFIVWVAFPTELSVFALV